MTAIRRARLRAGFTCAAVASSVGRTAEWLTDAEHGLVAVEPEHEQKILTAIGRLERFEQTVRAAREKLTADLKLPPPPARSASHAQ